MYEDLFNVEEPVDIKEIKVQKYKAARQAFLKRKNSSLKEVIEKRIKDLEAGLLQQGNKKKLVSNHPSNHR